MTARDALVVAAGDQSLYGVGAAIVIAMAGFAYTVYSGVRSDRRSSATQVEGELNDRVLDLIRQRDEAKETAKECAEQRSALERENLRLMRELFRAQNGGDQ